VISQKNKSYKNPPKHINPPIEKDNIKNTPYQV
jgi:hypothetical protein